MTRLNWDDPYCGEWERILRPRTATMTHEEYQALQDAYDSDQEAEERARAAEPAEAKLADGGPCDCGLDAALQETR